MQTNKYTFSFKKSLSQEVYIEKITKAGLENETNAKSLYFFIDEYRQVISIIKDILHNNSAGIKVSSKDDCDKRTKCKKFSILQDESHNNLILFTGQRGSGKTSVTKSIAGYLEKNDCEDIRFKCLPMVDPSSRRKHQRPPDVRSSGRHCP